MKKESDFKYYVYVFLIGVVILTTIVLEIMSDIQRAKEARERPPKVLTQEEIKQKEIEESNKESLFFLTVIKPLLGL